MLPHIPGRIALGKAYPWFFLHNVSPQEIAASAALVELQGTVGTVEENATTDHLFVTVRSVAMPRDGMPRRVQQATHIQAMLHTLSLFAQDAHGPRQKRAQAGEVVQRFGLKCNWAIRGRASKVNGPADFQGRPV
eukprot:CAMPEP_0204557324 /NCGR_PEP_ID=MMETSP0661-20131031/30247_1 /ASSEMBLY_ACC=CAM_ASM_000606 /TAXON_ID=109239 /ORGANISM="Alexandrium margalefi, Strain AMGDE01CS-322" /LENGTH=134 /DNA_ID=CAMNT_0051564447 /DNA_START=124 /DNA_END=528 /DNA_ORIENTATION=-